VTITQQQTTIQEKTEQYILHSYNRASFVLDRGEGMMLYDTDGNAYLDFASGISVNALGHADGELIDAVSAQIAQLSHVCNLFYSAPQADLAELLCQTSFADKVYFANSGAESIEAAIKFARKYARTVHGPGKTGIVSFRNSFHGRTMGALALTAKEYYQAPFQPVMPGVSYAPFNDIEAAERVIGPETCAVFVEPVQGEGGIHAATPEFLKALRAQCDRHGALLVFDEIQCGMGRTGTLWAYEQFGVLPDMMAVAKALGGGLPIGATLMTNAVAATIQAGDHGSTFAGGPVVCRAAEVVLRRVSDPAFLAHVKEMGALLQKKLRALKSPLIKEVRGMGLMVGIEVTADAATLVKAGHAHGVIFIVAGAHVLRLLPPLIVEEKHINAFVDALSAVLEENATA